MAEDPFKTLPASIGDPPISYRPITPNNDADLPWPVIGLYVGGTAGNVVCTFRDSTGLVEVTIPVAALSILPGAVVRVKATGTTATPLFGMRRS